MRSSIDQFKNVCFKSFDPIRPIDCIHKLEVKDCEVIWRKIRIFRGELNSTSWKAIKLALRKIFEKSDRLIRIDLLIIFHSEEFASFFSVYRHVLRSHIGDQSKERRILKDYGISSGLIQNFDAADIILHWHIENRLKYSDALEISSSIKNQPIVGPLKRF